MSETDNACLLLIGAYRDNEVSPAHPLMLALAEIRKAKGTKQDADSTVNQITLSPLDQPTLNRLIADTLSCSRERAIPLTELVVQKTKGNPFFANHFLKALYEDGLITFNFSQNHWQCDIAQVRALSVSDDVVEFIGSQLQKLPLNTQHVLKLAACIGNSFELNTLAIVNEKSQCETAAELWKALQEGLIIPISEVYKFFQLDGDGQESTQLPIIHDQLPSYKFLHDRVQQAAYFLISPAQKHSTHLKIGQLLLNNTPPEQREEKIFEIVNQLNMGAELIHERHEREELAQLNWLAGRKALSATAYGAAMGYFTVGRELLSRDRWQTQYELTLALYVAAAEAAYLNTDFPQMEELADVVLHNARTLLDKVKVYEVQLAARSYEEIQANPNRITIRTEVSADNNSIVIRIKDNGFGMSTEVKQQLFEHSFTTKPVGQGTGLGLLISRQIVEEAHGGKLTCSSIPGQGTEFAIALGLH